MIPTRDECLRLMNQYEMMDHIIEHSIEVARVALFLSSELNKKGQRLDLSLVEAASLLHDLTKTQSFKTKEDHARKGSTVLKGMGYERVGEVVAQHIHLSGSGDPLRVSEEEVVNYADKRVRHNQIVSLEDRFSDLRTRYGRNEVAMKMMEEMERTTMDIETKIFSILDIGPDALLCLPLADSSKMGFEEWEAREG